MKLLLFAFLILIVFGLLATLPTITIDKDAVVSSSAWAWIIAGCYFLPMGTVTTILTIIVALGVFRLIIAVVKAIWDMLPV